MVGTVGRSGGDNTRGSDPFPVDDGPQPPQGLYDDERAVWDDLLERIPAELLRGVDSYQLAHLCRCIVDAERCHAHWRANEDELGFLRMARNAEAQVNKLSALYGLSPADRSRLKFEVPVQDDAMDWESS
jgi:phage terminase small subunit